MTCSICSFKFQEEAALHSCSSCPLKKNCTRIKCPNCGFEMPQTPGWLKKWTGRKEKKI